MVGQDERALERAAKRRRLDLERGRDVEEEDAVEYGEEEAMEVDGDVRRGRGVNVVHGPGPAPGDARGGPTWAMTSRKFKLRTKGARTTWRLVTGGVPVTSRAVRFLVDLAVGCKLRRSALDGIVESLLGLGRTGGSST